jgi:hypothetical protein
VVHTAKKRRAKYRLNAAERLFLAAYGREMTAEERKRFIVEQRFRDNSETVRSTFHARYL